MVSKASEDFPEPERPVITVSELRGIATVTFFRLCWRAPRTMSCVIDMRLESGVQETFHVAAKYRFANGDLHPADLERFSRCYSHFGLSELRLFPEETAA